MTVRELSQLYYLKKLIDRDAERLVELESRLQPGSMTLTGMPHSPNVKSTMEEVVPLIVDLREKITKEQKNYIAQKIVIEDYIQTVDDMQIRLIMSYRFVDLLTWNQTALKIGGNNTEDSVKKACYRWLKKH